MFRTLLTLTLLALPCHVQAAPTVDELLQKAKAAWAESKYDAARDFVALAIQMDPKNPQSYLTRAAIHATQRKPAEAVTDLNQALVLEPTNAAAYDFRGSEQFKRGNIAESIADFDKFIELRPAQEPHHWKRGISYYYAGRYDDGRKQFEGYQTVDDNDVENAVWRYLCMARSAGVDKARAEILKIKNDPRVPMMQVYELYAGRLKPDDVLTAAQAGKPTPDQLNGQLFYAHLYLGLYYEATGNAEQARRHLDEAVKHPIGHYMWDVARVHVQLLEKKP